MSNIVEDTNQNAKIDDLIEADGASSDGDANGDNPPSDSIVAGMISDPSSDEEEETTDKEILAEVKRAQEEKKIKEEEEKVLKEKAEKEA
jgi:hypothetical protein